MTSGPEDDAGDPPGPGKDQRFGQELADDVAARRPERPAQTDLRAALQHGHEHDVGDSESPDEQRDGPQTQEQGGERRCRRGPGSDRLGWPADLDLLGIRGVRGGRQDGSDVVDRRVRRADVDRRRRAGRFEEVPGDRQADDRGPVDLGRERQRLQDADDREPLAADVDDRADRRRR